MTSLAFDKSAFLELAERTHPLSISIFMPTHRRGKEVLEGQDALVFKNHVQAIRLELESRQLPRQQIDQLLQPLEQLLADGSFWRYRTEGLAVYRNPDYLETFDSPRPLVSDYRLMDRFWARPLVPYIPTAGQYYLLQLGKKGATLCWADPFSCQVVDTEALFPSGLDAVTQYYEFEEELQGRTNGQGGRASIYTSDDANEDQKSKDHLLADYFRLVDDGIRELIGTRNVPLLLASVAYFQPIYRQVNTYPHLHETGITGNFDHVQPGELHQRANEQLTTYFDRGRQQRIRQYRNSSGTELTSRDLRQMLEAAVTGRVDVLFVRADAQAWGHFDEETLTAAIRGEAQPGDDSLIDQAALLTLRNGGEVYLLEPDEPLLENADSPMVAALFRF